MKQAADAMITLPVKAIFKAVIFLLYVSQKKNCVDSIDDYLQYLT